MFQKWTWPCLHGPSAGRAVDTQAHDDGMPRGRCRKADGLAGQACEARPSGQRLARALRRVACAGAGLGGIAVPRGGAPILARRAGQPAGRQQRCEPPTHGGVAAPTAIGPARAGVGSAGRPEPARGACMPDQRPPRIPLRRRCPSALQGPGPRGRRQGAHPRGGHRLPPSCVLRACPPHGVGAERQGARRITPAPGLETHGAERVCARRHAPTGARVEETTSPDPEGGSGRGSAACPGLCCRVGRSGSSDREGSGPR